MSLINIKEVKILIIISALYIANINYPILLLIILIVIVQLINYKFYKNNIEAYENIKLKYNYLNNNNIDIDSNQTNIYKKNKKYNYSR